MKKNLLPLLAATLLIFPFVSAEAQNTSVQLNVVLYHVNQLTINPEQTETTLLYQSIQDYQSGVEVVQKEHLTVFSTSPYVVNVKLADEVFAISGSNQNTTSNPLNLQVSATANQAPAASLVLKPAILNSNATELISSSAPSLHTTFDVSYKGPGNNELVPYVEENKSIRLTNNVIYSIEPR